jgi:triosephosphate isomerase
MRTRIVAGNWKMNTCPSDAVVLAQQIAASDRVRTAPPTVEVVVCPPHTSLSAAGSVLTGTNVRIGAQNCHHERKGAFTGEVSVDALVELGCRYVLVGHSERRRDQHETDALIGRKAAAACAAGLVPIICVGETLDERDAGRTLDVIAVQVRDIVGSAGEDVLRASVIAYEPVWAIGTGRSATPEQAQEVHAMLRADVAARGAASIPLLYGGSVTPETAADLFACQDIDGALVGGASLNAASFTSIVAAAAAAAQG